MFGTLVKVVLSKGKLRSSFLPFKTLQWLSIALRIKQKLYFVNTLTWPPRSNLVRFRLPFATSSYITLPLTPPFSSHSSSFIHHTPCCYRAFVHAAVPSAQSTILSPSPSEFIFIATLINITSSGQLYLDLLN